MNKKRREREQISRHYQNNFQENLEDMADARIITKNLVYVIGLSNNLADMEKLQRYEYFGQYGRIMKIVVNKTKAYNKDNPNGPSYSAYVTFSTPSEASIAILSLDGTIIDNHTIRASFGTTKYCSFFLKGVECSNKDCVFLHELANPNNIIKRGELNPERFAEQHAYATKIAEIHKPEVRKRIIAGSGKKTIFPPKESIYKFEWVNSPNHNKNFNKNKYDQDYYDEDDDEEYYLENHNTYNNNNNYNNSNNYNNNSNNNNNTNNSNINSNNSNSNNNRRRTSKINNGLKSKESSANKVKSEENLSKNKKTPKLFLSRETSRYNFTKNSNKPNPVVVPKYILNLITKKINLHTLAKYMNNKCIDELLINESKEKSLKEIKENSNNKDNNNIDNINDWTNFIIKENDDIETKNKNNDDLINDFDNINNFILEKLNNGALN